MFNLFTSPYRLRTKSLFVGLLLLGLAISTTAIGQTRPTNEERLIRIEEGVKNIEKRQDAVEGNLNKRIDDLRADMNSRFDDMSPKFNWLYILLSAIIALNGITIKFLRKKKHWKSRLKASPTT